ncbi:CRISPR-associated protein Cas4 [Hanamia caeni]|uniref:CRISPR-associated exonuclease Cas4 n=1 Tax=Hanamia caeni TaxID=2294116 RepID=A0A3M9NFZ6_9BACT|nr:CRISPR-associated protein Cas4 [Hanamia caeni]RNI36714.1 CRISPR-associated protein Cas4 [Hanamia caeni]
MNITATHINYYHICHRKLWLFANGINMEHTSDTVYDGKLLHETSYPQRAEKYREIDLSFTLNNGMDLFGKIDFYDAKEKIIHEIKRSDKIEEAHEWQVKFYIYLMELNGIEGVTAILEYPKLRITKEVTLSFVDKEYLKVMFLKITELIESESCPPLINSKICKSCSYYELCYVGE